MLLWLLWVVVIMGWVRVKMKERALSLSSGEREGWQHIVVMRWARVRVWVWH